MSHYRATLSDSIADSVLFLTAKLLGDPGETGR